ncbi:hypothetical protein CG91_gp060 [Mycobacterium phage 39HC]|uniref:hypothetical protein n=1 Tax=Mycobacterium phage 39HC TaxID=1463809 RepID=UPI0003F218D3|nr:hypothetical protein CG91_gp060 [Mycobacterium phage 39HC]AHJ88360.1 hypothetical protein 39HC_060 [Mycobacterium phage 39HC]AHJ88460.1 hypothetical protein 40BC_060 [Mycobacterium phage 40BC]
MTTTKTKTTRKPPKGDVRPETLAQFAAILNDAAERDVGFDRLVNRLYVVRAELAQITTARKAVFEHVKRAYEIGHRAIGDTPYDLRETEPGAPVLYRAVSSAAAKKADAAAWRRAHVVVPFVQVKAPAAVAMTVPHHQVPDASGFMDPVTAVLTHKEHPAWAEAKKLREAERWALTQLEAVGKEFDWPGDLKVFSDGWSIQLTREQYASEALAERDPALFDQLAEVKQRQAPVRVYIVRRDAEGADEGDWDETDGD